MSFLHRAVLRDIAQFSEPLCNLRPCALLIVLRIPAADGKAVLDGCAGAETFYAALRSGKAASRMGAEWDHRLAGEIIALKKHLNNPRQIPPPDGITDEPGIIYCVKTLRF